MSQGCNYGKVLHEMKNFERVRGTDEVMQIKEWCKEKGDLKDFRTEFQTFFVYISATI